MRVNWYGPFAKPTGYARASHDYLAALSLYTTPGELSVTPVHDADPEDLEARYAHLLDHVHRPDFAETHRLIHSIPACLHEFVRDDLAPAPGVRRIGITTWETDALPRDIAERLAQHFDLIVVPCTHNRSVFIEAGVPVERVAVVPHTYDPAFWRPTQPRSESPFVFYSVGVWSQRKNLAGLLRAYLSEFSSSDDVVLRVATPYRPEGDVQQLCARMGIPDLPRVEFITHRMSEGDLLDFHSTGSCYVSVARGEGWALGAFEAAIMDNPVIMPGFGGQVDFLGNYPHWRPVPYQMTPSVSDELTAVGASLEVAGMRITPMGKGVPLGITAHQNWAEPDLMATKRAMRAAYTSRAQQTPRGAIANDLAKRFSYEVVGRQLRAVLEAAECHVS